SRSHSPSGASTPAAMNMKARPPASSSTRMVAPAITPGSVPATSRALRGPVSRRSRQKRSRPPGTETTLNSRLVGVTAGLGTFKPCALLPDAAAGGPGVPALDSAGTVGYFSHRHYEKYPREAGRDVLAQGTTHRAREHSHADGGCGMSTRSRGDHSRERRRSPLSPAPARPRERSIAVIGAGASGTLTAVNLLRRGRVRVTLIDPKPHGPGVAYSTRDESHLLNVPAAAMSGLVDEPGDFLD